MSYLIDNAVFTIFKKQDCNSSAQRGLTGAALRGTRYKLFDSHRSILGVFWDVLSQFHPKILALKQS